LAPELPTAIGVLENFIRHIPLSVTKRLTSGGEEKDDYLCLPDKRIQKGKSNPGEEKLKQGYPQDRAPIIY
jgi:hypothetical protein